MRVLVTGGTGTLGRHVVAALTRGGHTVRVMSTRTQRSAFESTQEWAAADLATGAGVTAADHGVDAILHLASSPGNPKATDIEGTRRLVEAAARTAVSHLMYVSIVGIDDVPIPYYAAKRQAEEIIASSGVPYSIQRVTQFHSFLDMFLSKAARIPVLMPLPTSFQFQTIDETEVAEQVASSVEQGASRRLPDLAGPEVLTLGEMAAAWLTHRAIRKQIVPLPLPGSAARALRAGRLTVPTRKSGMIRWSDWLRQHGTR